MREAAKNTIFLYKSTIACPPVQNERAFVWHFLAAARMDGATVEVRQALPSTLDAIWAIVGRFDDLSWTGDDPWHTGHSNTAHFPSQPCTGVACPRVSLRRREYDGRFRSLKAYGMREQLLSCQQTETGNAMTYRMLEGPFEDFEVTLAVRSLAKGCEVLYSATGRLNQEEQAMVREGAIEALGGLARRAGSQAAVATG